MRTAFPRRRLALSILLGGAALAAAVLAWPWLRANLVVPLTLTVWLLLRMLVLSIHQGVYWALLVLAVPILLLVMLHRRSSPSHVLEPAVRTARAHPVDAWRWLVEQTAEGVRPLPTIGWNGFVQLAVSLKAVERRAAPDYRLHDALRDGRLPLPPEVHAFLFPPPHARPSGLAGRLRSWADAPRRALRRLSGRERAERLRATSRVLSFLERSLEMTSHDDPDDAAHR